MNVTKNTMSVKLQKDQLGSICWLVLAPVKSEEGKFVPLQRSLRPTGAEGEEGVLRHRLLAPFAFLSPKHAPT